MNARHHKPVMHKYLGLIHTSCSLNGRPEKLCCCFIYCTRNSLSNYLFSQQTETNINPHVGDLCHLVSLFPSVRHPWWLQHSLCHKLCSHAIICRLEQKAHMHEGTPFKSSGIPTSRNVNTVIHLICSVKTSQVIISFVTLNSQELLKATISL